MNTVGNRLAQRMGNLPAPHNAVPTDWSAAMRLPKQVRIGLFGLRHQTAQELAVALEQADVRRW